MSLSPQNFPIIRNIAKADVPDINYFAYR
jgi:hypothetical protein